MREKLARIDGTRATFHATFSRFGTKTAYKGPPLKTVLLVNVTDAHNNPICDHLWFNFTKGFEALNLQPGDRITFDGRAREYQKGYQGRRGEWDDDLPAPSSDYKLSHPTNIRLVKEGNQLPIEALPLFAAKPIIPADLLDPSGPYEG